jgi:hypothetical protein
LLSGRRPRKRRRAITMSEPVIINIKTKDGDITKEVGFYKDGKPYFN